MWHSADSVLSLCLEVFAGERSGAGALEALVREDVRANGDSGRDALGQLARASLQCALLDLARAPVPFFPRLEVLATGQRGDRSGRARDAESSLGELVLERCVPGIAELSQLLLRHGLPPGPGADGDRRRQGVLDLLRIALLWPPALSVLARAFDPDRLRSLARGPGGVEPAVLAGCLRLPRPDPYRVRSVSLMLGDVLRATDCEGAGAIGLAAVRATPLTGAGDVGEAIVWELFRHALVRVAWARKIAREEPSSALRGALFWSPVPPPSAERWDPIAFRRYGRPWMLDLLTEAVQRRGFLVQRQASVDSPLLGDDGFEGLLAEVVERVLAFRRSSVARRAAAESPGARAGARSARRRRGARAR